MTHLEFHNIVNSIINNASILLNSTPYLTELDYKIENVPNEVFDSLNGRVCTGLTERYMILEPIPNVNIFVYEEENI